MKRGIILLISLLLMNYSNLYGKSSITVSTRSPGDSIRVLSSPDLYNLTAIWASEYNKLFPETKINVIKFSEAAVNDNLLQKGAIGFVSNKDYSGFDNRSLWKVVVARDVIVTVINSNNPYIDEIYKRGISTESMTKFLSNKESRKWGILTRGKESTAANLYWMNDESVLHSLSVFLQTNQINTDGIIVQNSDDLISAIQKDPYAIGFCKMINILDLRKMALVENIRLLPIDRNGNGVIDYNEKIYDDINVFSRGVWIGKYPKALISNIYSVSSSQPSNASELAFLRWVLNDGQKFLYSSGYSDLLMSERQTTIDKLYPSEPSKGAAASGNSLLKTMLIIAVTLILAGLIIDAVIRYTRRDKTGHRVSGSYVHNVLDENSLIIPRGLYYDKTHTWAFMDQNGIVKVGIDDFLQHVTGALTRIKMKNQGKKVKKGDQILSIIQNGKQLNLYSPVSGIIIEQNLMLENNTSLLNSSPYTDGWIYKIEPSNWLRENQLLFMADKHRLYIMNEFSRLKDFLAGILSTDKDKFAGVVLQDGGVLKDGILTDLGPEVWEDFQTNFIDPSRQFWFYELV